LSLSACGARNFMKTASAYYRVVVAARSNGQWRSWDRRFVWSGACALERI